MQSMRRQKQWRALWRHHLRGLQRVFSTFSKLGGELSMSEEQKLRRRQGESQSVSVLPPTKVPQTGNEPGR